MIFLRSLFVLASIATTTSALIIMPASTRSGTASVAPLRMSRPLPVNNPEDWPDHPYNDYDFEHDPPSMSSPDRRGPIGDASRPFHRETSLSRYEYNDYSPRRTPPPRGVWNEERDYAYRRGNRDERDIYRDDRDFIRDDRDDYRYDRDEFSDERGFRDVRGYGNTAPIDREPRTERHSNQFGDYTPRTSPPVPKSAVRTYYPDNRDDYSPRSAAGSVPPSAAPRRDYDDDYSRSIEYSRSGDDRRNVRYSDDECLRLGSVPPSASRDHDDRDFGGDRFNEQLSSRNWNDDGRDRRSDDDRESRGERRRGEDTESGSMPQSALRSRDYDDRRRSFDDRKHQDEFDDYDSQTRSSSGSMPQPADERSRSYDDRQRYDDRNPNEDDRYFSARKSSPSYDSQKRNSDERNRSSSPVDNREPGGDWKTSRYGDYTTPTRSSAPVTRTRLNTDRPGPGNTRASPNNREPSDQFVSQRDKSKKVWNAGHNARSPYSATGLGDREPRGFRSTQPYANYNSLPTKSSWNANADRRGSGASVDDREPLGKWETSTYNDYSTPTRTGTGSTISPRPQARMTSPAELGDNSSLGSMSGSGSDANFAPGRRSTSSSRSEQSSGGFPGSQAPPAIGTGRQDGFRTSTTRTPRTAPPLPAPAPIPDRTSSTSRADRLGGPATTIMPPAGQSTTTASSYAEQMRATAAAESENTNDGASAEYLAAMSGAASTPRVMPPPPPPLPPPPAPVPAPRSSTSRLDRLGGPTTTMPPAGQSVAPMSAASYAEQMRATAPAESENINAGASSEYLAAMSGAASAPRVMPPPPPPPPAPILDRASRVAPSSTLQDANTAAGADYLSGMSGGTPQKMPPKSAPKTASSGAAAFGADYLSAMSGGGAPPPDWSQAKASPPAAAPAATSLPPANTGDSSRKGVEEIRVWLSGVLGQHEDFGVMQVYANRFVDLGVDSIQLLLVALTQEDVRDFDWMTESHKQRLIERGGLKKA